LILGDLTIQGNIKGPASITEALQLALDTGALRALLPVANKSQFAALPEEGLKSSTWCLTWTLIEPC
jgi:ATP-dependent Lon protease